MQAAGLPAAFAYAGDRLMAIGDRRSMARRRFAEATMLPNLVHCHRFAAAEFSALSPICGSHQMRFVHPALSTFAVENSVANPYLVDGSRFAPSTKDNEMRMFETAAAGLIALAAQILVVGTVMI
jgi:hypothetical protein